MWIGISGKMGSGKDYFAENYLKPYIENVLHKKCLIISFADMIKINLMVHNNLSLNQLYGKKTNDIRKLLQLEGTDKGRNIHGEDIWIKYLKAWGELHISRGINIIIIPDLRFINEYNFIKNMNGITIRINSPERNEKRLTEESIINDVFSIEQYNIIKNHQSEIELDNSIFDYNINNHNDYNTILSNIFN